jgi:butyryl-CoA dehydrogenase
MDLLGRKVLMEEGKGLKLLADRMTATMHRTAGVPALAPFAKSLGQALAEVGEATQKAWATGKPAEALANAVPYMQAFGHTVLAWIWLDVAAAALDADGDQVQSTTHGRMGCARFFFRYELPKVKAWLAVVHSRDMTCADFPEDAF